MTVEEDRNEWEDVVASIRAVYERVGLPCTTRFDRGLKDILGHFGGENLALHDLRDQHHSERKTLAELGFAPWAIARIEALYPASMRQALLPVELGVLWILDCCDNGLASPEVNCPAETPCVRLILDASEELASDHAERIALAAIGIAASSPHLWFQRGRVSWRSGNSASVGAFTGDLVLTNSWSRVTSWCRRDSTDSIFVYQIPPRLLRETQGKRHRHCELLPGSPMPPGVCADAGDLESFVWRNRKWPSSCRMVCGSLQGSHCVNRGDLGLTDKSQLEFADDQWMTFYGRKQGAKVAPGCLVGVVCPRVK